MNLKIVAAVLTASLVATPLLALDEAPAADPATSAAAAPAPAAPPAPDAAQPAPAAAQTFSDADIELFARAIIAIRPITADATLDETVKQQKMVAALGQIGIQPTTFNSIAAQSQTDAALKAKVVQQLTALRGKGSSV